MRHKDANEEMEHEKSIETASPGHREAHRNYRLRESQLCPEWKRRRLPDDTGRLPEIDRDSRPCHILSGCRRYRLNVDVERHRFPGSFGNLIPFTDWL
jgi:hypothetical protein